MLLCDNCKNTNITYLATFVVILPNYNFHKSCKRLQSLIYFLSEALANAIS